MNTKELIFSLYNHLNDLHWLVMFIVIIYGLIVYKQLTTPFRYVWIYMLCWLIAQTIQVLTLDYYNIILFPAFAFAEFTILSIFYYKLTANKKHIKTALYIFIPLMLCINGLSFFDSFNPQQFQAYGLVLVCMIIVFFSVMYIINSLKNTDKQVDKELLNLNTTFLAYNGVRLIIFSSVNFMLNQTTQITAYFWFAFVLATVVFDLRIGYLLWKHGKGLKALRFGLQ